jgi:hypothetical protein
MTVVWTTVDRNAVNGVRRHLGVCKSAVRRACSAGTRRRNQRAGVAGELAKESP